MKFTSSQSSQAHYNPTIIYFYQREQKANLIHQSFARQTLWHTSFVKFCQTFPPSKFYAIQYIYLTMAICILGQLDHTTASTDKVIFTNGYSIKVHMTHVVQENIFLLAKMYNMIERFWSLIWLDLYHNRALLGECTVL